ncbi:hypothetical protein MASR2M78_05640 [Treponema sp.]
MRGYYFCKKGRQISGFEITEALFLEELKATGIRARHSATGADLFHILNDDEENLFAFALCHGK